MSVVDNGKVIKAINANSADSVHGVNPVVIEELQVFGLKEPVRSLSVVRGIGPGSGGDRLIAVSDSEVQSLKLHRCNSDKIKSCRYFISDYLHSYMWIFSCFTLFVKLTFFIYFNLASV